MIRSSWRDQDHVGVIDWGDGNINRCVQSPRSMDLNMEQLGGLTGIPMDVNLSDTRGRTNLAKILRTFFLTPKLITITTTNQGDSSDEVATICCLRTGILGQI